jgi:UDP-glucose 4-epimerase
VRLVRGSLLDGNVVRSALEGASIVFHLAALTSVPRSVEEPERYAQVNVMGTVRMLEGARAAGAGRFVFASSSSAYGDLADAGAPKDERMPARPVSPYAATKCAGELLVRAACRGGGIDGASLRYFNIFGSRQRPDSPYAAVIPRWIEAMLARRPLIIFGDGRQTRDFTHVANAAHANLLAGAAAEPLRGEVINIASGDARSLLELRGALQRRAGAPLSTTHEPPRTGDVLHSRASIEKARRLLGYEPVVGFDEGLDATVAWFTRGA